APWLPGAAGPRPLAPLPTRRPSDLRRRGRPGFPAWSASASAASPRAPGCRGRGSRARRSRLRWSRVRESRALDPRVPDGRVPGSRALDDWRALDWRALLDEGRGFATPADARAVPPYTRPGRLSDRGAGAWPSQPYRG